MFLFQTADYVILIISIFPISIIAYKGNAKVWWQFAYKAILETEIKRRKQNWSWLHMLEHRNLCRTYAETYRAKLTCRKVTAEIQKNVDTHEERLDLFNLLLIRNRVDLEVEKSGILKKQEEKQGSWFSGWWGGNKNAEDGGGDKDICKSFLPPLRKIIRFSQVISQLIILN